MTMMQKTTNRPGSDKWAIPIIPDTPMGIPSRPDSSDDADKFSDSCNSPDSRWADYTADKEAREGKLVKFSSMDDLIADLRAD